MSRLLTEPLRVEVGREGGLPRRVLLPGGDSPLLVVGIHSRWRVEADWWRTPLSREYWKLGLRRDPGGQPSLVCDVFHDLLGGGWHLTRVYD